MQGSGPPTIFSPKRRAMMRRRMLALQQRPDAGRYLADDAAEDIIDRLSFLRHEPAKALLIGTPLDLLAGHLRAGGCEVSEAPADGFDPEQPYDPAGFDLIVSLFVLETTNDLPGALIHLRRALNPGGLAIAILTGAGSLPVLRQVMLAADGERPAPRLHPQVDVRAGGQLLQRAGFADPVIDSRSVTVRFGALQRLIGDLRAQGLSNVLADPGPPLTRAALARAQDAFTGQADAEGRVTETFEILTLSGWRR